MGQHGLRWGHVGSYFADVVRELHFPKNAVSPRRERHFGGPQGRDKASMELRWDQVGLCWPLLDARWPMLVHVELMLTRVGLPRPPLASFLNSPWLPPPGPLRPPCTPMYPHVPPYTPISETYISISLGLAERKEVILREIMYILRKRGPLLDGARVPRFPSYMFLGLG